MIKNKAALPFLAISLFLLVIYGAVLLQAPTLSYDDEDLIFPLKNVSQLSQYMEKVKSGDILDRQPIRDLSYWLELQVEQAIGFRNSQFVNVLLLFACLLVFYVLLKTAKSFFPILNEKFIFPVLILTAVHPVVVPSVAWAASRKHLLSGLFILLSTYFLMKLHLGSNGARSKAIVKTTALSIIFYYTLSLFSQPINLMWLAFAGVFLLLISEEASLTEKIKRAFSANYLWMIPCLLVAVTAIIINWSYYSSEIFMATQGEGSNKILDESVLNILKRFHILGRYFLQLVFPFWASPAPYELFDFRSLIGLILFVGAVTLWFKTQLQQKLFWFGFTFLMAPIFMMTIRLTNHGGWDTYLFTPLFGFMFLVYSLLSYFTLPSKNYHFFESRYLANTLFVIIAVFFIYKSWSQAQVWADEDKLWTYSNELDQTVYVKGALAKRIIARDGVTPQVIQLVEEIQTLNPKTQLLGYLLGRLYFSSPGSFEQKKELFEKSEVESPWLTYFLAATYAQNKNFGAALKTLDDKFKEDPKKFVQAFIGSWKQLADNWRSICDKANATDCDQRLSWINQYLTDKNQVR